jgi:putative addiction module killer protein
MDVRHAVHFYQAGDGSIPFIEWLRDLADPIGRHRIRARLKLLEFGHLGDWKFIGHGVFELRVHTGPGYRVYCGKSNQNTFVILWAGAKGTQARDIARAIHYWTDYARRIK